MPRHTDGLWEAGYDSYGSVEVMNTGAIGRGDAIWEAGDQAGRYSGTSSIFVTRPTAPFHDSYSEYFSDIKSKGKDYSIIPEFRITDHLRFYREQGNNFLAENTALFSIAQSTSGSNIPQNSDENRFFRVFSNSDFLKHFEIIRNDHKDVLEPHTLTLKCNAIKKFLPYNGFYPAERTVEVAKQFYDSYSDGFSIVDDGTAGDLDARISDSKALHRNFLKPLFAPGILFNTIKAGLAVDYPVMTSNDFLRAPQWETTDDTPGHRYYSASFAVQSNSSYPSRVGGVHHSGWDARIPFEALIEPTKHLSNIVIADDEPSDLCRANVNVIWSGEGDSVYREMMHNFLAESVGFFIKGGKTTGISSRPEKRFESVLPGRPYGMRIKLWRTMDGGKKANGDWGDFVLPQNTREVGAGTAGGYGFGGKIVGAGALISPRETFTMYSRPSAFGPPLGLLSASGPPGQGAHVRRNEFSGSLHDWSTRNGVYASHTPPYYDGESWIDLIFWPKGMSSVADAGDANVSSHYFALDSGSGKSGDHSPYRPTLAEIFSEPSREVLYSSASNVPLNGTFIRKWRFDREELLRTETGGDATASADAPMSGGTYQLHGSTKYGPSCGPWMNIWAMQGDASMNIFDSVRRSENDLRWRIQTKFETPMLNFNHVGTGSSTFTEAAYRPATCVASRGMWHQFGRLPLANTGVYMQVTDIPSRWLDNHPSANVGSDLAGVWYLL
jgi:hypothetical protein